jgi:uncharacterized RmlC-like cupin family protein
MSSKQLKQITSVANLIAESKEYLKEIGQIKSGGLPFGIVIRISDPDGNESQTIIYELNKYILILPKGERQHARMYGNWEEALYASQQLLVAYATNQKEHHVSICQYNL